MCLMISMWIPPACPHPSKTVTRVSQSKRRCWRCIHPGMHHPFSHHWFSDSVEHESANIFRGREFSSLNSPSVCVCFVCPNRSSRICDVCRWRLHYIYVTVHPVFVCSLERKMREKRQQDQKSSERCCEPIFPSLPDSMVLTNGHLHSTTVGIQAPVLIIPLSLWFSSYSLYFACSSNDSEWKREPRGGYMYWKECCCWNGVHCNNPSSWALFLPTLFWVLKMM